MGRAYRLRPFFLGANEQTQGHEALVTRAKFCILGLSTSASA